MFAMKTTNEEQSTKRTQSIYSQHHEATLSTFLLIVKRYIYSCKYTKHNLNFIETINIIKYHRNIEKFILSEKEDMLKNKWENLIL